MFKLCKNLKIFAFSLLEIMVAIAIVAIVMGVATPAYISYINKSRVVSAITTLNALEGAAKLQYENNPTATSFTIGGTTFTNGAITALDAPPVINGMYIPPDGDANVDAKSFLVCVYVGKLNFSTYVAPTPGSAGTHTRICKQVTAGTNIYTNKCGALQGSSADIPTEYLPFGCNCPDIWGGSC